MRVSKRAFAILIIAMLLSVVLPGSAFADDESSEHREFQYGNLFYYMLIDGELHVTRAVDDYHYDGEGAITGTDRCQITSLVIPETLDVDGVSYPVEYIDGNVWDGRGLSRIATTCLPSSFRHA